MQAQPSTPAPDPAPDPAPTFAKSLAVTSSALGAAPAAPAPSSESLLEELLSGYCCRCRCAAASAPAADGWERRPAASRPAAGPPCGRCRISSLRVRSAERFCRRLSSCGKEAGRQGRGGARCARRRRAAAGRRSNAGDRRSSAGHHDCSLRAQAAHRSPEWTLPRAAGWRQTSGAHPALLASRLAAAFRHGGDWGEWLGAGEHLEMKSSLRSTQQACMGAPALTGTTGRLELAISTSRHAAPLQTPASGRLAHPRAPRPCPKAPARPTAPWRPSQQQPRGLWLPQRPSQAGERRKGDMPEPISRLCSQPPRPGLRRPIQSLLHVEMELQAAAGAPQRG